MIKWVNIVSKDNFKDEFEKSKQKIERESQESLNHEVGEDTLTSNDSEQDSVAQEETNEIFPPRGASRRNRSMERKNREKTLAPDEKVTYEGKDNQNNVDESVENDGINKKRDRSIIASATGVGGSVVGNVATNKKGIHGDKPLNNNKKEDTSKKEKIVAGTAAGAVGVEKAHAETGNKTHQDNQKVKQEQEGGGIKKFLPILAAILLLVPIILLLSTFINNQDDGKPKTEEVVVKDNKKETNKKADEKSSEKATNDTETTADKTKEDKVATEDKNTKTNQPTAEDKSQDVATNDNAQNANTTDNATTANNNATNNNQTNTTPAANGTTSHVVGAQENLYRIAIKYYGAGTPENVDKIRRANGISGNNLSAGQTLVIPK